MEGKELEISPELTENIPMTSAELSPVNVHLCVHKPLVLSITPKKTM